MCIPLATSHTVFALSLRYTWSVKWYGLCAGVVRFSRFTPPLHICVHILNNPNSFPSLPANIMIRNQTANKLWLQGEFMRAGVNCDHLCRSRHIRIQKRRPLFRKTCGTRTQKHTPSTGKSFHGDLSPIGNQRMLRGDAEKGWLVALVTRAMMKIIIV